MLVLLYFFVMNVVIPDIMAIAGAAFEPVMIVVIIGVGILMVFASVGVHISNNLGSTVAGGIFGAFGWLVQQIFRGIGWIFRSIWNFTPRFYRWLVSIGVSVPVAILITVVAIIVII